MAGNALIQRCQLQPLRLKPAAQMRHQMNLMRRRALRISLAEQLRPEPIGIRGQQPRHPFGERTYHVRIAPTALSAEDTARIAEGVLAIEMAALAKDVALTIHPHPTLSETVMESAEVFYGTSTHIYRPKRG